MASAVDASFSLPTLSLLGAGKTLPGQSSEPSVSLNNGSVSHPRRGSCRAAHSSRVHTVPGNQPTSQLLSIMVRLHVVSFSAVTAWFSFSHRGGMWIQHALRLELERLEMAVDSEYFQNSTDISQEYCMSEMFNFLNDFVNVRYGSITCTLKILCLFLNYNVNV